MPPTPMTMLPDPRDCTGVVIPYAVVGPYSNVALVTAPFGFTVAFRVAPVRVIAVVTPVTTVGAGRSRADSGGYWPRNPDNQARCGCSSHPVLHRGSTVARAGIRRTSSPAGHRSRAPSGFGAGHRWRRIQACARLHGGSQIPNRLG